MPKSIDRVQTIKEKIELIFDIVDREFEGKISKALEDARVYRPAILMHLIAIAEQISRLKDDNAFEILEFFSHEDLRGISDTRNFIAHDYEGLNLAVIETAIRFGLKSMLISVENILKKDL